jgi:hypothetical protein
MAQVRYAIVFGIKDAADRFLPQGEIYLRNTDLEQAKSIFKSLPSSGASGDNVVRIYERYYDKHLDPDMDYQKTEFTIECSRAGLDDILHFLLDRES